jgi:hypothetical protein
MLYQRIRSTNVSAEMREMHGSGGEDNGSIQTRRAARGAVGADRAQCGGNLLATASRWNVYPREREQNKHDGMDQDPYAVPSPHDGLLFLVGTSSRHVVCHDAGACELAHSRPTKCLAESESFPGRNAEPDNPHLCFQRRTSPSMPRRQLIRASQFVRSNSLQRALVLAFRRVAPFG